MIEAKNLTKQFKDFLAVDDVGLDVQAGQVLALLGQNGAGKTTTIRMLTGLLRPTSGSARIAGYDVVEEPNRVRSSVGVLAEQHGLYKRMTAVEYLDFFGKVYGLDAATRKKRSNHLLDYFGLARAANQKIGEYSKGMKQKLALARSLIHEPPALLFDEPTSAMDPESARLVRDEIANLRSSRRAIIICTHNLTEAEALADQIAIIYRGKILVKGTVSELKEKILGPAEYEILFSQNWDSTKLKFPPGIEALVREEKSLRFRTQNPERTNPLLLKELSAQKAPVLTLEKVARSLEQVYLRVMAQAGKEPLQ